MALYKSAYYYYYYYYLHHQVPALVGLLLSLYAPILDLSLEYEFVNI